MLGADRRMLRLDDPRLGHVHPCGKRLLLGDVDHAVVPGAVQVLRLRPAEHRRPGARLLLLGPDVRSAGWMSLADVRFRGLPVGAPGQGQLCIQATLNALLLTAEGWARVTPLLVTIVIDCALENELSPAIWPPIVAEAALN